jgi:Fe2+ transport system protein FeoA
MEKYFEGIKGKKEAHRISHIIEHHISREVLDNLRKLSTFKEEGLSLSDFKGDSGSITDITLEAKQFERIISMGIFPGERIKVVARLPNGIVVRIENKKIFFSWEMARDIKVVEYAKA